MTAITTDRTAIVPPSPPSTPRVCLVPVRAGQAVLDGGWWPRSADPVAELPGLVLALDERYGPIRQIMLNRTAWDSHPGRLAVGSRVVRLGWFASVDAALVIATTEHGAQLDLLVVAPGTAQDAARRAMARAADPADTTRAPDILLTTTAVPARPRTVAAGQDTDAGSAWDNEGGRQVEKHRPQ
jgi:hypothetical protein